MSKPKYYHSLDFFRGVCGYGVAITHLHAFIFESQLMEYFSLLFVEFFFVLSGFVLYPQLLKTINNKKASFHMDRLRKTTLAISERPTTNRRNRKTD